jgi:hypothetical protein
MQFKMKKMVYIFLMLLMLISCKIDEVARTGILQGRVSYTGASNMEIDVIITLTGIGNGTEETSVRIPRTGEYSFELPTGEYLLELRGNHCKSDDLPYKVKINSGETRNKDINVEQLSYSMVIMYQSVELQEGQTIKVSGGMALDIWNKYSSNTLNWDIRAYPDSWIKFEQTSGTINGGGKKSVVFSIEKDKMPNYGVNYADVILTTTTDNGSFTIKVSAEKDGGQPGKAVIEGNAENICPATSVTLTAIAENPDQTKTVSYRWYRDNTIITNIDGNIYEATQSGTYYVVAINAHGEGVKSDGKTVTINKCPEPPVIITGNATNVMEYTATLHGNISFKGDPEYFEKGFVYGITHNPTIENNFKKMVTGIGIGEYSSNIEQLTNGTIYYVRAYAKYGDMLTVYGEETHFKTLSLATVQTISVNNSYVTETTATVSGYISNAGNPEFIEKGICYGLSNKLTLEEAQKVPVSGQNTSFNTTLTGLDAYTTYYACAYAINEIGGIKRIAYGNTVNFQTKIERATVSTSDVIKLSSTSVRFTGVILKKGNPRYTERGFVYSTFPVITDNRCIVDNNDNDTFTLDISLSNTYIYSYYSYYVRAYVKSADNSVAYGEDKLFFVDVEF